MKKLLLMSIVILASLSCSKEDEYKVEYVKDTISPEDVSHGLMVLGRQLEDPYSLENVNAALKSLYPTKAGRVNLTATDVYVRFLPQSLEQYNTLLSMGLHLVDHPLDYEIVEDGDYYHDPSLPEDAITWQYAVVSSDFSYPSGILCEILDKCYIPDNNSVTRSDDGIDWGLVERRAFEITGNQSLLSSVPNTKSSSSNPKGRITIVDEKYNGGEAKGVAGVRISCNSFVKFANAYTDSDGYYEIGRQFSGKIHYRIVFQNSIGFAIGFNKVVVPASTSTLGSNEPTGVSYTIDKNSDRNLFRRAVVNNTTYEFYERASMSKDGFEVPPANLRFWLLHSLSASSTPMLQHGVLIDNTKLGSFLGDFAGVVKMFLPDITLGLKDADDYSTIYALTVHELAHASHYSRAGKEFWKNYINYILTSWVSSAGKMYGDGDGQYKGYCEVGEMWAYYLQNELYSERYPSSQNVYGLSDWFYPQVLLYLGERGLSKNDICLSLGPDVSSRDLLRQSLKDRKPQYKTIIDQAFQRYGK